MGLLGCWICANGVMHRGACTCPNRAVLARALTAVGSGGSCGCVCEICWCTDRHCGRGSCAAGDQRRKRGRKGGR